MAELADALDSKSSDRKVVGVQVPPPVPFPDKELRKLAVSPRFVSRRKEGNWRAVLSLPELCRCAHGDWALTVTWTEGIFGVRKICSDERKIGARLLLRK